MEIPAGPTNANLEAVMSSTIATGHVVSLSTRTDTAEIVRRITLVAGRILFGTIFLLAGRSHFEPGTIQYAASAGVPFAAILVPASGVLAALGALSLITGWHARLGALAIALFLVPVTLSMHAFWTISDPMMRGIQYVMFLKNVSMFGAALLFTQIGVGTLRKG